MVSCKKNGVLPFPYFFIQSGQNTSQILVQTNISVLYFLRIHSKKMAHIVRTGKTDGQKIGDGKHSPVLSFQCGNGKILKYAITNRRTPHYFTPSVGLP